MGKKNQPTDTDYPASAKPASLAALDGYRRLALGAVLRAIEDYHDPDPVTALDALLFILDPLGAAYWLDALDFGNGDPAVVFRSVTDDKTNNKLSRRAAR